MSLLNRLSTSENKWQGKAKKVLCVCSAGLLRSPTAALVLSQEPFNYNTRAAGVDADFALVPVDQVLLHWADEVVCMTNEHMVKLAEMMAKFKNDKPLICLQIPDTFAYRDPELMKRISESYKEITGVL